MKLKLLLINIPLKLTIDACVETSFISKTNIDGLRKNIFHGLLTIFIPKKLVLFVGDYYQETDGVAKDSSLATPYCYEIVTPTLNDSKSVKILIATTQGKIGKLEVDDEIRVCVINLQVA